MRTLGVGLLCLLSSLSLVRSDKSVIVSLASKWPSTSILAETSEFIGRDSNSSYYDFVSSLAKETRSEDYKSLSAEKKYELALKHATPLLSASSIDLLKMSLAIRAFSPAVQLFQQVGEEYRDVECECFFDIHGITGCTVAEMDAVVAKAGADSTLQKTELLSVDHVLSFESGSPVKGAMNVAEDAPLTIILYGSLGTSSWAALHTSAKAAARTSKGIYVHRHFSRLPESGAVFLSGYGVELAIKNTEYKAEDDSNQKQDQEEDDEEDLHGFNIKKLKELHPEEQESLSSFRMHLKEVEELAPLKQWQVQNLTYQAAQRIMNAGSSSESLPTLKELSQNFPLHARSLSTESVDENMRSEIEANQGVLSENFQIDAGESALYMNGIVLDVDSIDLFQVLEALKQEEKLATGFSAMGYKREYLKMLADIDLSEEKANYAVDYREAQPLYVNNLDKDKRYSHMGNSVKLMLQPYYPGMIRPIARNIFTLIFVLDPAELETSSLIRIANSFVKHDIPLRIGLVLIVSQDDSKTAENDAGVAVLRLFNYLQQEKDGVYALAALSKLYTMLEPEEKITVKEVREYFESTTDGDWKELCDGSEYDKGRTAGKEFLEKSAIGRTPKVLLNGYPLDDAGIRDGKFEETVMMEVMRITPKIQRAVMSGKLTDKGNVQNWLIEQPEVMPRLNKMILEAPVAKKFIDLSHTTGCTAKTPNEFTRLSKENKASCIAERMRYEQRGEEDSATRAITLWMTVDLEKAQGRRVLYSALKHVKLSQKTRVGVVLNPSEEATACQTDSISFLVHTAMRTLPAAKAKLFVPKLLKEENVAGLKSGTVKLEDLAVSGMNIQDFLKEKKLLSCDRILMEKMFAADVMGLSPGQNAVVANGMMIGPMGEEEFNEEDIKLLEKLLVVKGATTMAEHVDKWKVQKRHGKSSDTVMRSFSLMGKYAVARKRIWIEGFAQKHSVVLLPAEDESKPATDIVAIVDPLSRSAQKMSSILELLRSAINCDLKVIMNPKPKLSELPLKRFYRYVGASEVSFSPSGALSAPRALFSGLPSKQLLTLSLQPPDSWMIEPVTALYDLDNIKMEQVEKDVVAEFSLEHILLEGHCFEEQSGSPPRGLQFALGTVSQPTAYDTIVMANLGYFQLKASPGAWQLRLREGRSKDIYRIASHTQTEGAIQDGQVVRVLVDSFTGRTIRVRVEKRKGKEDESLLTEGAEDSAGGKLWNTISSTIGVGGEKHEKINVFSLASGHLYERFMRIMIRSVMKHTKSPVKFWLLKNYLSPQFKETLPIMAAEYGFDYALVEYKWPRWLHQQTEKHRIMWGYKILFLDVLFPLDVHKIIFVDADQVVRADLLDLMNFDLTGAPYGYVPFCESRKEMDGFRFWKQGYWANHLAGRQYHISALYVIDLQKFRQIAAGDRLRGQYQGLSSDPNSLSNLDQDLPNNMIHQVRIKSLPQEWLWCETWCDESSKKAAKTIDLCNNPMTKEPKLDSAMRIIPEWKDYDTEIKELIARGPTAKKTTVTSDKDEEAHGEL